MQGTRVYPDKNGWLDDKELNKPGSYGRATNHMVIGKRTGWWQITTPDGHQGSLNPDIHTVTEHEDGTITVFPSLDMSQRLQGGWHGWLEKGYFRSI